MHYGSPLIHSLPHRSAPEPPRAIIWDADTYPSYDVGDLEIPGGERVIYRHWGRRDVEPFVPTETSAEYRAQALVARGAWATRCPFCPGAALASRSDPRFFCVDCLCEAGGYAWVPVEWPEDAAEIETALLKRPDPRTRNWVPGETVEDLRRERREHGIGGR